MTSGISVPVQKRFGNLFKDPRICIYENWNEKLYHVKTDLD